MLNAEQIETFQIVQFEQRLGALGENALRNLLADQIALQALQPPPHMSDEEIRLTIQEVLEGSVVLGQRQSEVAEVGQGQPQPKEASILSLPWTPFLSAWRGFGR